MQQKSTTFIQTEASPTCSYTYTQGSHTCTHLAMTKYACMGVFTVYRHLAYIRMYLLIGVFTLHRNAHQMEANWKHIESILFTLVFEIHGQCSSYVLMVMQLLRVIKWPMRLPFYCCLTALDCAWSTNEIERRTCDWGDTLPCQALTLHNHRDNCPCD